MSATRTQVYFTAEQRRRLDARAAREGRTLAAVVREAVDAYLSGEELDLESTLAQSFGSMPGLEIPDRGEWDRGLG
jgi:plasmid stability protein